MNAHATSQIPHSPSRTVRITRLRDEHERFPGILGDSVFQRLHENAFIIHNGDSRDLVAAYALWTIIDQNGRLYTHEYMVDIYAALMPTSVVLAGKDIIVSPNGWIFPHEYSDARRAFDARSINLLDSRLTQATKISLSIDAVIFADGETCGVNTKRLDQAIVARRNAAISLAAKARDAMARGEPAVSSEDLFEQSNDKSSEGFWRGHFGRQLSSSPEKDAYLRYFESLPRPPAFYASRSTD
jgi:hypothetical protein